MLLFSYSEHSKYQNGRERLGQRRGECRKIELTFLSTCGSMGTGMAALCWNSKAVSKYLTTKIQSRTKNTRLVRGKMEELQQNRCSFCSSRWPSAAGTAHALWLHLRSHPLNSEFSFKSKVHPSMSCFSKYLTI